MNKILPLSGLLPGQTAQIVHLFASGSIRRRLQDIGIIPGTYVKCVMESPFGDPDAYLIRGAVIAIRKDDARNIAVDLCGGVDCGNC